MRPLYFCALLCAFASLREINLFGTKRTKRAAPFTGAALLTALMDSKNLLQELVKEGLLSEEASRKILQDANLARRTVEDLIYEQRLVDEESVANAKSRLFNIPYKKIKPEEIPEELLKLIPEETVRNYKTIPVERSGNLLAVGMLYPDDLKAQEALKFIAKQLRTNLGIYIVTPTVWETVLRRYSSWAGLPLSASNPAWIFGWSVLTRPPKISGKPVTRSIGTASMPASARAFAVPPVEMIRTPISARARANATTPVLSDTLIRAVFTIIVLLSILISVKTHVKAFSEYLPLS